MDLIWCCFQAAGLQLAASCDIAVCSEKSTFSTPGASFGIFCRHFYSNETDLTIVQIWFINSTPGIAISRVIPRMKSSYMLLTGLPISSDEALRTGLVSSVVPSEKLDEEVAKISDAIKSKSRAVVSFGKKFYYQQLGMDLNSAYTAGATAMADNLQLEDGIEGIKSFIEKRKPQWRNEWLSRASRHASGHWVTECIYFIKIYCYGFLRNVINMITGITDQIKFS